MLRKSGLIGHLQPIDGVATASLAEVKAYFASGGNLPNFAKMLEKEVSVIIGKKKLLEKETFLLAKNLLKVFKDQSSLSAPSSQVFAPIALLSLHRQFFETKSGQPAQGPVEQVFTIGPKETVEVRLEEVRKKTYEESKESGQTSVDETSRESKNTSDFTDKFLERFENSSNASVSANVTATYGVVSGGISGTTSWASSQSKAREKISQIGAESAQRTAQTISRNFSVRSRSTEELTQSDSYRKLIQNDTALPINYGLVRYTNKIRTYSQIVGRSLCWRFMVSSPGSLLANGGIITSDIVPNNAKLNIGRPVSYQSLLSLIPGAVVEFPGVSAIIPKQALPADPSTVGQLLYYSQSSSMQVDVKLPGSITSSEIFSNSGLLNVSVVLSSNQTVTRILAYKIVGQISQDPVNPNRFISLNVKFNEIGSSPSNWPAASADDRDAVATAFKKELVLIVEANRKTDSATNTALLELVTAERSALKRPARDLRIEESWAILGHISALLQNQQTSIQPTNRPVLELYFDLEKAFHVPSGFLKPRPQTYATLTNLPAPLGSSVGWVSVPDADETRNRFVNSDFVEVILPMLAGKEEDALTFLSNSNLVTLPDATSLRALLGEIKADRDKEKGFGEFGPDDVIDDPSNANLPAGIVDYFRVSRAIEIEVHAEGFGYKVLP